MTDKAEMEKMLREVLQDLGLNCTLMTLFETPDKAYEWCMSLSCRTRSPSLFQVCVQWKLESTYESVKADLKARIQEAANLQG